MSSPPASSWGRAPAIVLGCSPSGLGVIRALADLEIPIVAVWHDRDEIGRLSSAVDVQVEAPDPDLAEDDYVQLLDDLAVRTGGGLLVPTSDACVGVVARRRSELEKRYVVACVDWEVAQRFLDKEITFALAAEIGVRVPRTFELGTEEDVEAALEQLVYPCVVKPRHSHLYVAQFGSKMEIAHDGDQAVAAWRAADRLGLKVLAQEFIPGPDTLGVNFNTYFWDGRPVASCTAQKLRLAPPRVGAPRALVSRDVEDIAEPSIRLLRAMDYSGFANVEFKRDPRDGSYSLMEVNGRHNLSTLLSVRSGVNFPAIMYRHLIDGELPQSPPRQETGRYWIAFPSDLFHTLVQREHEQVRVRDFIAPYLRPHVFDVLALRDPRPFVGGLAASLRRRRRKSSRSEGQPDPSVRL